MYSADGNRSFDCSGTWIHYNYVLTAAHCVNEHLHSVHLREVNESISMDCISGEINCLQDIPISKKIVHEDYVRNSQHKQNDIALLHLRIDSNSFYNSNAFAGSKHLFSLVCLPFANNLKYNDVDGKKLVVAGWRKAGNGSLIP